MRGLPSLLLLLLLLACTKEAASPTDLFRVITTKVTGVGITTAQSGGQVISGVQTSSADIIARGVCFGQFPNPTIADPKTTDGVGAGEFVSNLTGLLPGTKYYLRAYATIAQGTVYGEEFFFTTLPLQLPMVITRAATDVTHSGATTGGDIVNNGGLPVIERGVCFGLSPNPSLDDNKILSGTGTGVFTSLLTNLCTDQPYYVRAFATTGAGTGYGNQIQFTTGALSGLAEYSTTVLAAQNDFSQCLPSISGSVQLVKESSGDYSISDASFGLYGCVYFFPPATGVSLTVDCGVIFLGGSDQGSKSYTLTSVTTNGTELTIEWINSAGDAARTTLTRTGGWPMNLHL